MTIAHANSAAAALLAAGLPLAAPIAALAQHDAPRPLVSMYFGDTEQLLADPLDESLLSSLRFANARLNELPAEIAALSDDDDAWRLRPLNDLLGALLWSDLAFDLNLVEGDWGPVPSFRFVAWPQDADDASRLASNVVTLADEAGASFGRTDADGLQWSREDDSDVAVGAVDTDRGEALLIAANMDDPTIAAPHGDPIFRLAIDFTALDIPQEELDRNPEMAQALRYFGVTGEDAIRMHASVERRDGLLTADVRLPGVATLADRVGFTKDATLEPDVLRLAPIGATALGAGAFDFGNLPDRIERAFAEFGAPLDSPDVPRPVKGVYAAVEPFFTALGDDILFYRSLETGGGGMLSSIVSVDVDDRDAMSVFIDRWVGLGNGAAAGFLQGYVSSQRYQLDGATAWSIRTTGLPTPADLTIALADDRLVVGLTSTSVRAALAQHRADSSVLDSDVFRAAAGDMMNEPFVSVSFTDMAWHAADAYYLADAATITLANAVRQRFGGSRDPGLVSPTYAEFTDDVRPAFSIVRWDGDDLHGFSRSDGSLLVNAAVGTHLALKTQLVGFLPSTFVGGLQQARAAAAEIEAADSARIDWEDTAEQRGVNAVKEMALATLSYAAGNDHRLPARTADVIPYTRDGQPVASPLAAAPDEFGDYAVRTSPGRISDFANASRAILVIDRAAFLDDRQDDIPVAFADASVRLVDRDELEDMLDEQDLWEMFNLD